MRSRLGIFASIVAFTFATASGIAVATGASGERAQATVNVYEAPQTATTPGTGSGSSQAAPPLDDRSQVAGARVAARLKGRALFGKHRIRVGEQTSLTVNFRNLGNGTSGTGRVCVRLSTALVVVKLPKGVTNQGSLLCAKRTALKARATRSGVNVTSGGNAIRITGVVVRGVRPTSRATVRDGVNDGVSLTGDSLQVVPSQSRGGGVTG